MKLKADAVDIFNSLPDELLIQIALKDPEALEELCIQIKETTNDRGIKARIKPVLLQVPNFEAYVIKL